MSISYKQFVTHKMNLRLLLKQLHELLKHKVPESSDILTKTLNNL